MSPHDREALQAVVDRYHGRLVRVAIFPLWGGDIPPEVALVWGYLSRYEVDEDSYDVMEEGWWDRVRWSLFVSNWRSAEGKRRWFPVARLDGIGTFEITRDGGDTEVKWSEYAFWIVPSGT